MQLILDSFIPKSKLIGVGCGILISYLAAILISIPCYFIEGKILVVYSLIIYFCAPFTVGVITTLIIGYHEKGSIVGNILYSQLSLILSFIIWAITLKPNLGYVGAFLLMCFPILMVFTVIGTLIGCEWLLRKGKLEID